MANKTAAKHSQQYNISKAEDESRASNTPTSTDLSAMFDDVIVKDGWIIFEEGSFSLEKYIKTISFTDI